MYATVQSAVDAAEAGDEIRIAEGVYTEVNHYSGLAQSVYLSKTVTLCGGYSLRGLGTFQCLLATQPFWMLSRLGEFFILSVTFRRLLKIWIS